MTVRELRTGMAGHDINHIEQVRKIITGDCRKNSGQNRALTKARIGSCE